MFKPNKALLSILILSGLTVQTTQPVDWSWLTNSSIYRQGNELCSRLSKSDTYQQCAPYGSWLFEKAKEHKVTIAACMVCGFIAKKCYDKYYDMYTHRKSIKRKNDKQEAKEPIQLFDKELQKINNLKNVSDDDWQIIKELIEQKKVGVDHFINPAFSEQGYSALYLAIEKDDLEMVKWLIKHETVLDCFPNDCKMLDFYLCPILFAAKKGLDKIFFIIADAGKINSYRSSLSFLIYQDGNDFTPVLDDTTLIALLIKQNKLKNQSPNGLIPLNAEDKKLNISLVAYKPKK